MLNLEQIVKATNGTLLQKGNIRSVRHVVIDSRRVKKGSLFIAIKGERLDGHRFTPQALKQGACCLLVSRKVAAPEDVSIILVNDTTQALGFLAREHRRQFNIPIIAITGSAGKTTTKEMIAAVLSSRYQTLKNYKTENNHIGVPLTLLKLTKSHRAAVIEFGTNRPGDIIWLAMITEPTMAVFTNIGDAHLEGLKSRPGIFKEKSFLLKYLKSKGRIIFNYDDPFLKKLSSKSNQHPCVTFSLNDPSDFRATHIARSKRQLVFKLGAKTYQLNSLAAHNIYNALAAISCGSLLGIPYNELKKSIQRFRFPPGRFTLRNCGKIQVIDDTYNANPLSMRSAVTSLVGFPDARRRIVVCADMLELGKESRRLHEELGSWIAEQNIDFVFSHGEKAKSISRMVMKQKNGKGARHFAQVTELSKYLKDFCQKGDVLLVKGSRSMKMERIVEGLMN